MRFKQLLAATALVWGAASLVGGCVENRSTLYVEGVAGINTGDSEETCELSPEPEFYLSTGLYDPTSGRDYVAYLIIGNQLVPRGNNDVLSAETSRIQLEGAVVRVFDDAAAADDGGSPLLEYTTLFAGTVQPEPSTAPGYNVIGVRLMTPSLNLTDGLYISRVEIFGTTLGNQEIEGGPFDFPIEVVNGGLIACDESFGTLNEAEALDPCGRLGQDLFVVPCRSANAPGCDSFCP